jgi:hypothetical protein
MRTQGFGVIDPLLQSQQLEKSVQQEVQKKMGVFIDAVCALICLSVSFSSRSWHD